MRSHPASTRSPNSARRRYDQAESIEFEVRKTGEVQTVTMYDSPISISGEIDKRQTCYLKSRTKPKLLDRMLIIEYGIERHVDLLLRASG